MGGCDWIFICKKGFKAEEYFNGLSQALLVDRTRKGSKEVVKKNSVGEGIDKWFG